MESERNTFSLIKVDGVVHFGNQIGQPCCRDERRNILGGDAFIEMDDSAPLTCLECLAMPWVGEPLGEDFLYFEHAGYRCANRRGPVASWNGYVLVPITHPWAALDADALPVEVHGGLSWKQVVENDTLVSFGFDCGHHGDWQPLMPMTRKYGVYRTLEFAREWTRRLAEQLRKVEDVKAAEQGAAEQGAAGT